MAEKVIDRFFRYVQIDTQSKEDAESFPSTEKQKNLAMLLAKELQEMGFMMRNAVMCMQSFRETTLLRETITRPLALLHIWIRHRIVQERM